ncbi:MAG TPA: CDF family Co(II)/Ni(II) efflux transporter DmeF [Marinagarivorans sp.]
MTSATPTTSSTASASRPTENPNCPSEQWRHDHQFSRGNPLAERNTRWALLLTVIMMVAEISGGWMFNSMALLADGWHMSSHALALGLAVAAYSAARRFAHHQHFSLGTWKIEILGGYTSALFLLAIAGIMLFESVARLLEPRAIQYDQAIALACLGLAVNLVCAWLLKDNHHHHHSHDHHHHHGHQHDHGHRDLNLRAAYIHVLTDAATSVLAIIALFGGKFWGASWLDPVMGIIGAIVVTVWAVGLIRDTARVLLDAEMDKPIVAKIESVINRQFNGTLTDLHVSRVAQDQYACVLSLATPETLTPDDIKQALNAHNELVHITVEVNHYHHNSPTP